MVDSWKVVDNIKASSYFNQSFAPFSDPMGRPKSKYLLEPQRYNV